MGTKHIGRRIREVRKLRQLTVRQLADRARISVSSLEKYERGDRNPPAGVVTQLARALHVGPERLHGQPYWTPGEDYIHGVVADLRRVLLTFDSPEDLPVAPRELPVLSAEVDQISAMRRDAQYAPMGPLLPPLITELTHAALGSTDDQGQQAFWHLARAYRAVNSLAHKLGHHDLSNTALERVTWAAGHCGDPLMQFTAGYLVAGAMVRQGALGVARRKLLGLREELERSQPEGCYDSQAMSVDGALLLKLAIVEARSGDIEAMRSWLAEARHVAHMLDDQDTLAYETSFGPTNIRIHEISALLDLGDTEQALALAGEWGEEQGNDVWAPPEGTVGERASHHWVDFAAVQLAEGDRTGAFLSLKKARQIAPNHARFHPIVRSTAATLVRLDRAQDGTLAGFARWAGV